jgi:hypothetical protein
MGYQDQGISAPHSILLDMPWRQCTGILSVTAYSSKLQFSGINESAGSEVLSEALHSGGL